MSLTSSVMGQMMARFRNFYSLQKSQDLQCVSNMCEDLFKGKKYFGVRCTMDNSSLTIFDKSLSNLSSTVCTCTCSSMLPLFQANCDRNQCLSVCLSGYIPMVSVKGFLLKSGFISPFISTDTTSWVLASIYIMLFCFFIRG